MMPRVVQPWSWSMMAVITMTTMTRHWRLDMMAMMMAPVHDDCDDRGGHDDLASVLMHPGHDDLAPPVLMHGCRGGRDDLAPVHGRNHHC